MPTIQQASIRWPALRRLTFGILGATLALSCLAVGATILAHGPGVQQIGLVIAALLLVASALGTYLAVAALWGGWAPRSEASRIRTVRAALSWALVVGLTMLASLPLLPPQLMTRQETVSAITWLVLLAVATFAILRIRSTPRITITALIAGAAFASVLVLQAAYVTFSAHVDWGGPERTLSFLIPASFAAALIAAALLAWPLRAGSSSRAT